METGWALLIFIVIIIVAIAYFGGVRLFARALSNVPGIAEASSAGSDDEMRAIIAELPMLPDGMLTGAKYNGVVGAAHVYSADRLVKMYPLCCNKCRARAVYWMRAHADSPDVVPARAYVTRARPESCFSQRYFTPDCDPVRRYVVLVYEPHEPLSCTWADERRDELARVAQLDASTVLENCAVYNGNLRVLHLDMPKFPKTSAVAEYLEMHS